MGRTRWAVAALSVVAALLWFAFSALAFEPGKATLVHQSKSDRFDPRNPGHNRVLPGDGRFMRSLFALLVVLAVPLVSAARSTRWLATIQSEHTGDTATVTLKVRDACRLVLQTPRGSQFSCPGWWHCSGKACPARRGRLTFFRLDDPLAATDAQLRWRRGACDAHFVGVPQPGFDVRPFHWQYACFTGSPLRQSDSGTFTLDVGR